MYRVYLLEGLATIIFSGVVWFVLPDYPKSPRSNKWLSEREQNFIEIRLSENAPLTDDPVFTKSEIVGSLKTPIIWAFMISQMLVNLAGYALQWYLPTITTNLGFASLPKNQLLNIPPAAAALLGIIFSSYFINWAIITRPAYIAYVTKSDHCDYNSRANQNQFYHGWPSRMFRLIFHYLICRGYLCCLCPGYAVLQYILHSLLVLAIGHFEGLHRSSIHFGSAKLCRSGRWNHRPTTISAKMGIQPLQKQLCNSGSGSNYGSFY
jgi:hypothetical protein